ncbi:Conserved hypothetical membrane protein [Candidatus Protochlamydia naegleriophila]|uniref:histidine kinase n=1 Tax=Candidatus Protochlamydia naegleriophila TaxID=389348 RepID=A0A0U5JCK3_9BACT|nr:MASE1 domain-containing protein [Candidatus Protochlamydia naegleriophila]CUI16855.1 Conserved hypothetical membrane protein [Candidatus Protochlamydia naegleriophila]
MEKKIFVSNNPVQYVFLILVIAFIYFIFAQLGQHLALPEGIATAVWPPSGFALTIFLLFGYRIWPGIFLGASLAIAASLAAKWPFFAFSFPFFLLVLIISMGATLQSMAASYLLNRLQVTSNLFHSYKHVYLFFIVIFLSCLINSTIAITSLNMADLIPEQSGQNWITWWLGDAAGMFVVTPLILSWFPPPSLQRSMDQAFESIQFFLVLGIVTFLCFGWLHQAYPLEYLLIPCLLWAIFRFGAHLATLTLAIISVFAILGTAKGYGPFFQQHLNTSLLLLQLFIGVISAMTLTLIAVLNQLKQANAQLKTYNENLESQVSQRTVVVQERTIELQDKTIQLQNQTLELQWRTKELQERTQKLQEQNQALEQMVIKFQLLQNRVITQEKLSSLGALTVGIAHQLRNPLNFVINFAELNQDIIVELIEWLESEKENIKPEDFEQAFLLLSSLKINTEKIENHGKGVNHIVEKMVAHAQNRIGKPEIVDINELVEEFSHLAYYSFQAQNPNITIHFDKSYDLTIEKIQTIPQLVSRALINIFNNAFHSVSHKKEDLGDAYNPTISIRTENRDVQVAILIRDNGNGIPSALRDQLFLPFFTTKPDEVGFGLSISRDLISQIEGQIHVESVEGEFAEFTLLLPKPPEQ